MTPAGQGSAEYLVAGGAGFIGSNCVHELVRQGKSVRVLDSLSTGRMVNLEGILDQIEFVEGDIRDPDVAASATAGVRCVLFFAALPSVSRSVEEPVLSNEINVDGLLNMLMASRDGGVERFVFSSSSSVYGDTPVLPKQEDMTPQPLSPYALQKLTGEHYCRVFHELYGLNTFSLRYFNVFGPRQDPASDYAAVIPLFISAARERRAPVIHGDGGQTRDFTFVDDVVRANLCCCEAPLEAAGGVYNVAWGNRTSILELAQMILHECGAGDIAPDHVERRAGDVRDSQADSTRARETLGWNPQVQFAEGLQKTIEWFSHEPAGS